MAVTIRLKRTGTNRRPGYRIVVTDSRQPRDSSSIEEIGFYNPMINPPEIKIEDEKYEAWVKKGAQPSQTVKALLKRSRQIPKEEAAV